MLFLARVTLALLGFALGASLFSFLNVAAFRLPRREGIVRGRSYCPACGRTLGPGELIPCVSFLLLRGRCKGCGAPIPLRDTLIEALGGVLALACVLRWETEPVKAVLVLAALSVLTVAALIDADTMELWDRFHLMLLLCAAAAAAVFPEVTPLERLIGCFAVSLPMLALALLIPGGFGGGDIKLSFALGALLGWKGMLTAGFLALLGAGARCIWLLARKKAAPGDRIAFGPFLCAGGGAALFLGGAPVEWWLGQLR